jgi:hypothetical protein
MGLVGHEPVDDLPLTREHLIEAVHRETAR